ncbi:MBL fold metallo-hydrolase [Pelomyxa schiedti]|nr:MBL fold metallo-hydrolase [Pelomyxa schiedti]
MCDNKYNKLVRTEKIPNSKLTLIGHSRAGEATAFWIPELNWQLDAGDVKNQKPSHVFITHGHADHSYQLPYFLSRVAPVTVYAPAPIVPFLNKYIAASQALNSFTDADTGEGKYILIGVNPGDTLKIGKYIAKVVACEHTVPCVGYCFSEVREKLAEEYKGLPGKEIANLRKAGKSVTTQMEIPIFAYLGDTTPDVFEKNGMIFDYPTIITECTHLPMSSVEDHPTDHVTKTTTDVPAPPTGTDVTDSNTTTTTATDSNTTSTTTAVSEDPVTTLSANTTITKPKRKKNPSPFSGDDDEAHTHWEQLAPMISAHPKNMFFLIHFSIRHRESEIHEFSLQAKQRGFGNVLFWTHKI